MKAINVVYILSVVGSEGHLQERVKANRLEESHLLIQVAAKGTVLGVRETMPVPGGDLMIGLEPF